MEFEKVEREHIIQGIQDFEDKGMPKGFRPSSTYDLVYEGKEYPPKAIMAYANYHAVARKIERYFKGGIGTDCFNAFERNEFDVLPKNQNITNSQSFTINNLADELVTLGVSRKHFNIICSAFVLKNNKELSTRAAFNIVKGARIKIGWDKKESVTIGRISQDCQYFPGNQGYGFYSSIKHFEGSVKKNQLINDYEDYIIKNPSSEDDIIKLINLLKKFVFNEKNININKQEINFNQEGDTDEQTFIMVLKTLNRKEVEAYFNFLDLIKVELNLKSDDNRFVTGISKQRLNLTVGQRYCWNLYPKRRKGKFGVISTVKINETTEDYEGGQNDAFYTYTEDHKLAFDNKASVIKAISNEMERTTKSSFEKYNNTAFEKAMFDLEYRDEIFEKAFGSNNYFLVGAYWDGAVNPDQTNRFVSEGIWQNGYDDKFTEIVNEVVKGDQIAIKAVYTKGKKDSVMLIKARGTVLSNSQDGKNLEVDWDKTFEPFEVNFSGGYWATIKQVKNKEHINEIWGANMKTVIKTTTSNKTPINQILYGPPGTGKTYRLQNEYFSKYTISETNLTKEQHIENVFNELSWFQVITLIVLELETASVTQIIEHPLFKIKTKSSSSKNLRATVWGNLQAHTVEDCENVKYTRRVNPLIFNKDEDGIWTILSNELEELFPEAEQMLNDVNNFQPSPSKLIKNYEFITFHQSFSYEDFVEGIKPIMKEGETDLGYEIQSGVFKRLCKRAKSDPDNYYAIFIDEINRGNVSAIFGELITLIEKDKRAGAKNALEVQLPYSKEKFSVPINLHIYGTMNTADRSVEALDSALRRRFTFKELMPRPNLLTDIAFDGFTLDEVLKTINERIEILVDRDHTIGHSYFLSVDSGDTRALSLVFQDKIIPLLQEYFYHDYEKLALILGSGFVEENSNSNVAFANFKNIELPSIENQFTLIKKVEDIEKAVLLLLNKETETY